MAHFLSANYCLQQERKFAVFTLSIQTAELLTILVLKVEQFYYLPVYLKELLGLLQKL